MDKAILNFWKRGFTYEKNHIIENNAAIQTYKILMHFTEINKNCRVGCYISVNGFSEFFSLNKLIPSFDIFADVASNTKQIGIEEIPDFIKQLTHSAHKETISQIWKLKHPIAFEFCSKSTQD